MTTSLEITPSRFIASAGKLDSENNYMFKVAADAQFNFAVGQTLRSSLAGIRYSVGGVVFMIGDNSDGFAAATIPMSVLA